MDDRYSQETLFDTPESWEEHYPKRDKQLWDGINFNNR